MITWFFFLFNISSTLSKKTIGCQIFVFFTIFSWLIDPKQRSLLTGTYNAVWLNSQKCSFLSIWFDTKNNCAPIKFQGLNIKTLSWRKCLTFYCVCWLFGGFLALTACSINGMFWVKIDTILCLHIYVCYNHRWYWYWACLKQSNTHL